VILTSETVDEILWCDHSNETSPAVLSHGTIYISGTLGSERLNNAVAYLEIKDDASSCYSAYVLESQAGPRNSGFL